MFHSLYLSSTFNCRAFFRNMQGAIGFLALHDGDKMIMTLLIDIHNHFY